MRNIAPIARGELVRESLAPFVYNGLDFLGADFNFDDESRMLNPSGGRCKNGERIASVTDRISGLVLNEVNSGGPTLRRRSELAGRGYAKFNASLSGGLRGVVSDWLSNQRGHIWMVARLDTTSPTQQCLWSTCDEASTTAANLYAIFRGTSSQINIVQQSAADTADQLYTPLFPDPAGIIANGDIAAGPGNWVLLHFWSDGSTTYCDVNGITGTLIETTGANTGDWTADTSGRDNFCLGVLRRTSASNYFDGAIARVMAATGQLTHFEDESVRAYLDQYYGPFRNIGILGDSWSDPTSSWTEQARAICATTRFSCWNFVNCAVGGQTAAQIRSNSWTANLERAAAHLDVVVWMGTVNDMNDDVETSALALFNTFKATADEVLAAGIKLVVGEVGPWGGNTTNWTIARQEKHNEYTRLQRNYCAEHGAQFVPLFERLTVDPSLGFKQIYPAEAAGIGINDRIAKTLELSGGLHVNATGDVLIANRMISAIARSLGDAS